MWFLCCIPFFECVYCFVCARWACKRCVHNASHDSESWPPATTEEFEPVPRLSRYILAAYDDDRENLPRYGIDPGSLIARRTYRDTQGKSPPYLLYVDHYHADVVLAIRGLNLANEGDYAVLLDNKLGKMKFDGGYVHNGLLKSAGFILDSECDVLRGVIGKYPDYTLTFAGHSLGSGVAALMAILVVGNPERLGNVSRGRVRCYAIAPARCVSLNLAVRYADVINSVVLQDDFLPRTATPLEDIFKSLFWCMRDTCISEERMLKDPRRLYAPGRLYHIVERQPFRCRKNPPVVRTAVPVDGRFEHIVLSCSATSDHGIICIEREAERALELMQEKDRAMKVPTKHKMERQKTIAKDHKEEHKAALFRAVALAVPHAFSPFQYGTFGEQDGDDETKALNVDSSEGSKAKGKSKWSWDELIQHLLEKDECGRIAVHKPLDRAYDREDSL